MNSIGIRNVAYEYLCCLFSSHSCVCQTGDASLHLLIGSGCMNLILQSPEDLVWFEMQTLSSSLEHRSPGDSFVIGVMKGTLGLYLRTSYPDLGAIVQFQLLTFCKENSRIREIVILPAWAHNVCLIIRMHPSGYVRFPSINHIN